MDTLQQVAFINEIEKLKCVTRGNRTLDDRFENTAEHSWHVAMMALVMEQYANKPVDILKVIKMLLIHDIVEIDAGDTWLFQEDQSLKKPAEEKAADRIFALLPNVQAQEYRALWDEYEVSETEEAKFAHAMDGIQPKPGRPEYPEPEPEEQRRR